MSLVRWNPFQELDDMSQRLNRIFGRNTTPSNVAESGKGYLAMPDWVPTVDICETVEEFQIKAELPEVKKDDIKVLVDNDVLRIEGERKQEREEKGKRFHRIERCYGSFARSFSLPDNVDASKMQAQFKDGVLLVHLPKSQTTRSKAVEVKVH